jgi:hypothetical protein
MGQASTVLRIMDKMSPPSNLSAPRLAILGLRIAGVTAWRLKVEIF